MSYLGNRTLEDTFYFLFTTRRFSTGAPFTLAGTPVVSVYEENNTTQITAGVSLSVDYDAVTGLNQVTIVATAASGPGAGPDPEFAPPPAPPPAARARRRRGTPDDATARR